MIIKKRKPVREGLLLVVVILLILTAIAIGSQMKSKEEQLKNIKVGQVWEHYTHGDPFIKKDERVRKVIGVKMGYVQFIEGNKDTISLPEHSFRFNSIKRKK